MGLIDMSQFDRVRVDREQIEDEPPVRRLVAHVDHDRSAADGRAHRMIVDVERVQAIAARHGTDPDWQDVAAVLEHVRVTLVHDLLLPPGPTGDHIERSPSGVR